MQNFGAAPARQRCGHAGRGRPRPAGGHAGGNPARQDGQGAVPGAFSQRRPAPDHRPAGERRRGGRQLPLLRRSTCRRTCRCCWSTATPRPATRAILSWALAPGEPVRTGIRPQIETPRYLSLKPLGDFQAVNLANIDRLDSSAVAALEKYVAAGGGVAFFLGEQQRREVLQRRSVSRRKGAFPRAAVPATGRTAGRSPRAGPRPPSRRPLHLPRLRRQPEHVLASRDR